MRPTSFHDFRKMQISMHVIKHINIGVTSFLMWLIQRFFRKQTNVDITM